MWIDSDGDGVVGVSIGWAFSVSILNCIVFFVFWYNRWVDWWVIGLILVGLNICYVNTNVISNNLISVIKIYTEQKKKIAIEINI